MSGTSFSDPPRFTRTTGGHPSQAAPTADATRPPVSTASPIHPGPCPLRGTKLSAMLGPCWGRCVDSVNLRVSVGLLW